MSTFFGWFNITIPPVPPKTCKCAFYDKIPCKRMSCGSSLFHLNILLARYWTISTRVLIGTHIKKYVCIYIHTKKQKQHHPHRFLLNKSTSWLIDRPQVWKKINTICDSNQDFSLLKTNSPILAFPCFYDALHLAPSVAHAAGPNVLRSLLPPQSRPSATVSLTAECFCWLFLVLFLLDGWARFGCWKGRFRVEVRKVKRNNGKSVCSDAWSWPNIAQSSKVPLWPKDLN